MFNNFNRNSDDDLDSKRIQEVKERNQTRNISPSFSYGEQDNVANQLLEDNQNIDEQEQTETNSNVAGNTTQQNTLSKVASTVAGGALSKGSQNLLSGLITKKLRMKILMICIPTIVVIFLIIMIVIMLASSKGDRNLSKNLLNKFNSITYSGDSSDNTSFPPIGENEKFEDYFDNNVKEYLINYLSKNGYCSSDKKDCEDSDAYAFFKRYLEVIIAFEREKYYIDSGLLYETIGYSRSDEEMFLGSTEKIKDKNWFGFLKNIFSQKTDEISKLANKMWREMNGVDDTYWKFSLDKYVAYLMYGDTMKDISDSSVGTNKDLNIKASDITIDNKGEVTRNEHTYQYGNCTITDKDYEGDITSGYIYMRFKDDPVLNVSADALEDKIAWIIQQIFNQTIEVYGESNYCINGSIESDCSAISITKTRFTKQEFVTLVTDYANNTNFTNDRHRNGAKFLAAYAEAIYDMGVSNNVNPEMVFIRASAEGYSPGKSKNNFWGIGCYNGCDNCCITYPSIMKGVEAFIKNISQYDSVESMMSRYAYIGPAWYKGSWSTGGCIYFPYIEKYYEQTPEAQASKNNAKAACDRGGDETVKTTDHDQLAYSKWQVVTMVEDHRTKIFKIGADSCSMNDLESLLNSNASIGEKAAKYAVQKFDSFGYSQAERWSDNYVDCSSLVYRTYKEFGIDFGGASTADGELRWCQKNNRMISESELQPGDLLFAYDYAIGKSGHVEIYIGNDQRFGAHTANTDWANQVSIKPYKPSSFKLFCRPY